MSSERLARKDKDGALVQLREGSTTAADVQGIAAQGVVGTGGPLPHLDTIQRSFGGHDVSGVQAHTGGAAREATDALGASAYASGNHVAFNRRPDLHTAAHEAAHAVQQRQGVSLYGGVGVAGDRYERQADAAADAVVAGRSAEAILGVPRTPGGTGHARTGVQMKGGKKFRRGTELSQHKSSTQGSKEDIVKLMHGSEEWRAEQIQEILTTRTNKGNQLFFHLQTLVMGTTTLAAAYTKVTKGGDLNADIDATGLKDPQKEYLKNCVRLGMPSFEDKLKLALGITTKTGGDKKEVDVLVETDPTPASDKLVALTNLEVEITKLFGGNGRYKSMIARLKVNEARESGPARGESKSSFDSRLRRLADRELATLILSMKLKGIPKFFKDKKPGIHMLEKKRFKKDLDAWIKNHTADEHRYVIQPGSRTSKAFDEVTSDKLIGEDVFFTTKKINYFKRRISNSAPVGDEFYQDDDRDTSTMGEKGKEEREEDKSEHGAKIGALRTHLDKKVEKHQDDTGGTKSKKLKKLIKALSDEEKDWFLRSYLTPNERQEWDDPETDLARKTELRDVAIKMVGDELKLGGLGHGGEFTELREKLLKRFEVHYVKTPTFQRIKDLAKSKVPHQTDPNYRGPKLLALVRKLRGDEFATLRGDKEIMDAMQAGVSQKHWEGIQAILGIGDKHEELDGVTGTVDVDLFRAPGDKGKRRFNRDQAREMGQDEAELKPSHWGMLLTATLKHSKLKKSSEVNSLVTRAYTAGKRRERLTKGGKEKSLSGDQTLSPMTVGVFLGVVLQTISPGAMKIFESEKKFANALEALRNGTRPTVDQQLEDAIYRNKGKYASGDHLGTANIEKTFEGLSGADLLDEWSNFAEFSVYKARFEKLKGREKRKAKEQLRTFVIDIRKDRHAYITSKLSPKSAGQVLKSLRMKLADAMEKDPEVIEVMAKAGFDNDELSQAKVRTLALGDEQKLRSTGAQYNTINLGARLGLKLIGAGGTVKPTSKSAQSKESMSELLGSHRKVESELSQGKDREEVVDENIEDLKHKQEEMVRRGKNFDKMQKKYNRAVTWIAKALVTALIGAAMGALTVLTGGVGGVLAVALGTVMITAKTLVLKAVELALQGDRFNTTKAVCDLAFKAILGAATGALAEFAVPEVLEALGQGIVDHTVNVGFESMTNVAPTDPGGIATKAAIEFALGKGAKGVLKSAYKEITSTKQTNPALRAMIMLEMGGQVLAGGATVAQEVFAPVNEALQSGRTIDNVTGNRHVDMGLEKTAQGGGKGVTKGLGYMTKAGKYAPKLRKLLGKYYLKKHKHGEDRDENLGEIIPGVIESAKQAVAGIDDQIAQSISNNEELDVYGALAQKKSEILDLIKELEEEYAAWQEQTEQKRGMDNEVSGAGVASVPLLMKAIELDEKVHGES